MTTSAYDHNRTVTAFFDTHAAAEKAKANVIAAGVPGDMVSIVEGHGRTGAADPARSLEPHNDGFWESLKSLFAPDEDKHAYAEGLSRGGFLLTANTSDAHYDRVIDILDDEGAVDMNEREAQWKSEGWSGRHDQAPAVGSSMAAARGLESPVATRGETSRAATIGTAAPAEDLGATGRTTGTGSSMAAGSSMATGATGRDATTERAALDSRETTPVADTAAGVRGAGTGGDTMHLAEESMRVGKRDVAHGRVRLRSYVVEKPVQETVNLRSETVDMNRRPVDRPLAAGEDLFQERTIAAEGHHEEAVVSKDAHVYEEVGLTKTAQDHTKEIKDSVRRTELEVDDARNSAGTRTGLVNEAGMAGAHEIAEHMDVIGSDGEHVGTVDHLDTGDRIKLTKSDSADGQHHFIPRAWVARVDNHVHLNKTGAAARNDGTV